MNEKCNCTNKGKVKTQTPGEQVDHYTDPTSEAIKQEIKSLNNLGAPEDQSPAPDTIAK